MELRNLTIYFLKTRIYRIEPQSNSHFPQPKIVSVFFFDKVAKYFLHRKTSLEHVQDTR